VSEADPVFRGVDEALRFAFRHPQGSPERSLQSRLADGPSRPGKGLAGLDGAGQAGFVLSALASLGEFYESIAQARYLPHSVPCSCGSDCCTKYRVNPEWRIAIDTITDRTTNLIPHRPIMLRLRKAVVVRYFGEKVNFVEIAKGLRVDRDTVSNHANVVASFLKDQERLMRSKLIERLGLES
jgi:hypothetical protein